MRYYEYNIFTFDTNIFQFGLLENFSGQFYVSISSYDVVVIFAGTLRYTWDCIKTLLEHEPF